MSKFIIFLILFSELTNISQEINIIENTNTIYSNIVTENQKAVFSAQQIPNHIYEKMLGKSIPLKYKDSVDINSLSYLRISYFGFDNKYHIGEMIVNSKIADEVLQIFKELYEIKYPIEKIKLIDEYEANDELSMSDNNTSCFCYRAISGTGKLSNHAIGIAIDINPLYNPYLSNGNISPSSGSIYANRSLNNEYQINKNDAIYKIFIKYGWTWGGDWANNKDYQHFEKKIN